MRYRTETPEPTPTMPVAPMLDMAFQILAFFILIYHPASSERAVPLQASGSAGATSLKRRSQPAIAIDIVADTRPRHAVLYRLRTEEQNTAPCDVQTLHDRLASCRPGSAVRIVAQPGIPMSDVVAAVDAAAAAGLTAITFGEPAAPGTVWR